MAIVCMIKLKWQLAVRSCLGKASENPCFFTLILFIATILPWFREYITPPVRSLIFSPFRSHFWHGLEGQPALTEPALFLLVNIVILWIWFTSTNPDQAANPSTVDDSITTTPAQAAIGELKNSLVWTPVPSKAAQIRVAIPIIVEEEKQLRASAKYSTTYSPLLSLSKLSSAYLSAFDSKQHELLQADCSPSSSRCTNFGGLPAICLKEEASEATNAALQEGSVQRQYTPLRRPPDAPRTTSSETSEKLLVATTQLVSKARTSSSKYVPTISSDSEMQDVKVSLSERSATGPMARTNTSINIAKVDYDAEQQLVGDGGIGKDQMLGVPGLKKAASDEVREIVVEKDELNERIEAFFARFRAQLRQDSLRCASQKY